MVSLGTSPSTRKRGSGILRIANSFCPISKCGAAKRGGVEIALIGVYDVDVSAGVKRTLN